jgi:hypothetical protein
MNHPAHPFIEGTSIQFAWDSTSLGYLKTCPRLYRYIMVEGWGAKDESIHLRFGSEYHKALEDFDHARCQGADFEEALRTCIQALLVRTFGWEVDHESKAGRYKNRESLVRVVVAYLDHFRHDKAETYVLENGKPAVELSFKFQLDFGPVESQPYILCGHLDRVVVFADSLFVMDRKTTTMALGSYYFAQFEPNNQMSLYTLASQVEFGTPIKGVIIDAAQILLEKPDRFERSITYRTEDQLEEWSADLQQWLVLAEHFADSNHWPMNDTACDKFGGCRFREICSASPHIRDKLLAAKFTKLPMGERWNPLKPR